MNQVNYSQMVMALAKPSEKILELHNMFPEMAHLQHMALGVSGEVGELVDAIKKHTVYGKIIDRENVIEELGDIEFYLEGIRGSLGISREETIMHNQSKLSVRYASGGYSDKQAQERADKN